MSYVTIFCLFPYFSAQLLDQAKECDWFVISFDETFNRVLHKEQMDVVIKFFCDTNGIAKTRYLSSQFMGRATAHDIQVNLQSALKDFDLRKLVQVSMDGPSTNIKFLKEFVQDRSVTYPNAPDLIDIGVCSLHVLHGAFRTGIKATGWKIPELLRALNGLFAETFARRTAFTEITGCGGLVLEDLQSL